MQLKSNIDVLIDQVQAAAASGTPLCIQGGGSKDFLGGPLVGEPIQVWLLGGFAPDNAALNRFFSLHFLLPFVIAGVVILHIWALHIPGSSNPTGVEVKDEQDTVPFHPYYTAKDGVGVAAFFLLFAILLFFAPNFLGEPDNYIPANPMSTPANIVPEWYFWPFYAILRAFTADFILPAKLWGVLAMFGSILLWFFLPWLDRSPVRSASYRPVYQVFFWLLIVGFFRALGNSSTTTLAYADVPQEKMGTATSFTQLNNQLGNALGVTAGAVVLHLSLAWRGAEHLETVDFQVALVVMGLLSLLSLPLFIGLPRNAGHELSGHKQT